ncbi:hypothetical protein GUITHDRAFT_144227 [Guillardia theta CCMP2712]|uniref:PDZ domain-containing protein n=1 Tax=Guillardia theta (strain CCMP2712) TaxID=905079 RepID=L1IQC3_GUITC|nr:hypothetical protein GUITHDRAFT_144227 [Guillardia theta CCMP2712]EKX38448.1 hypothetical protein GUITHDRAFT_144227 [Guillardia theta CCMP2712]|eukprot:XP_005825428.1 hypothetical protein GUITHDRAFT_144227 [Guillardia theta CCMP2712]
MSVYEAPAPLVILVQSDVKGGWAYGRIVASEYETSFVRAQGFFPLAHCKALEPIKVRKPTSQDPRQAGVGLAVAFSHGIYGRLLIFSVKKGSAADRSCVMKVGDEILAIDGRPVQRLDYREIANMILGVEGSILRINVVDSILKMERTQTSHATNQCFHREIDLIREPRGEQVLSPQQFSRMRELVVDQRQVVNQRPQEGVVQQSALQDVRTNLKQNNLQHVKASLPAPKENLQAVQVAKAEGEQEFIFADFDAAVQDILNGRFQQARDRIAQLQKQSSALGLSQSSIEKLSFSAAIHKAIQMEKIYSLQSVELETLAHPAPGPEAEDLVQKVEMAEKESRRLEMDYLNAVEELTLAERAILQSQQEIEKFRSSQVDANGQGTQVVEEEAPTALENVQNNAEEQEENVEEQEKNQVQQERVAEVKVSATTVKDISDEGASMVKDWCNTIFDEQERRMNVQLNMDLEQQDKEVKTPRLARVVTSFTSSGPNQINLNVGDLVELNFSNHAWAVGRVVSSSSNPSASSRFGWFPSQCLEKTEGGGRRGEERMGRSERDSVLEARSPPHRAHTDLDFIAQEADTEAAEQRQVPRKTPDASTGKQEPLYEAPQRVEGGAGAGAGAGVEDPEAGVKVRPVGKRKTSATPAAEQNVWLSAVDLAKFQGKTGGTPLKQDLDSSDASSSEFTQAQWARQQLLAKAQMEREKYTAFDSGAVSKQAQWAREQILTQMKDGQEKGAAKSSSPRAEDRQMKFDPSSVSQQAKWAKEQLNLPEYNGKYGKGSRKEGENGSVEVLPSSSQLPSSPGDDEDREERRRRAGLARSFLTIHDVLFVAIKRALFLQGSKEAEQGGSGGGSKQESNAAGDMGKISQYAVEKDGEQKGQAGSADLPNYLILNNFEPHMSPSVNIYAPYLIGHQANYSYNQQPVQHQQLLSPRVVVSPSQLAPGVFRTSSSSSPRISGIVPGQEQQQLPLAYHTFSGITHTSQLNTSEQRSAVPQIPPQYLRF